MQITGCVDIGARTCEANTFGVIGRSQNVELTIGESGAGTSIGIRFDAAPGFPLTGETETVAARPALQFRADLFTQNRFTPTPRLAATIEWSGDVLRSDALWGNVVVTYKQPTGEEIARSSGRANLQRINN